MYHRKTGGIQSWLFGCPRSYPVVDWAKASRRFLEACATVKASLAQISMTLVTKGGQQALEGAKQQLQTTVNATGASIWDQNPTATNASIFASGPGTEIKAFDIGKNGGDPEEVRQYKLMCCMVFGVPETFLGDVQTGNLATATSLDRPTETVFLELQEAWIEDLTAISKFVLAVDAGASGGMLREAAAKHGQQFRILQMRRKRGKDGHWYYEAPRKQPGVVEVKVEFPAIREGDLPQLIQATVQALTLGQPGYNGIDEKAAITKLGDLLGIPNNDELIETMFPSYDPVRPTADERDEQKQAAAAAAAPAIKEAARMLTEAARAMSVGA